MRVIGTAGHVDHGKSSLVAALTGIHPDRLKEEREREMTIDLGFAWMELPDGQTLGIVDVPGHRDFIENMLAGVGGIDAALFVVAADEGVMPQTREHLAILDILQVRRGVVALTKIDLIDDPEWLELIETDVRSGFANTSLEDAPIVRVSARTGQGVESLKAALVDCLSGTIPRPDLGRPRLPIDRVFTLAGFGTIVTGTLIDGRLKVGDEVEILPSGKRGRIRGLQTHKQKEEIAIPGSRTAVNISGVEVDQIRRGEVLAIPNSYLPTQRIDAQFWLSEDANGPVKHNSEVKLFSGASEVVARVRVLEKDEIKPGEAGWLQLELKDGIVAVRGDRYILRRPSPSETLGGGAVLEPHPPGRHKRFSREIIGKFMVLSQGSPADLILQVVGELRFATLEEITKRSRLPVYEVEFELKALLVDRQIVQLEGERQAGSKAGVFTSAVVLASEGDEILKLVGKYHSQFPLRKGMPREVLKSRTKLAPRIFNLILQRMVGQGDLVEENLLIRLPSHRVLFSALQQARIDDLLLVFRQTPSMTPSVKECILQVGEDIYSALVESGALVQVSEDVVFLAETYGEMLNATQKHIVDFGAITVAEFRDRFTTSRKYALALLEHLDSIQVTVRDGDLRRLRQ